MSPFFTQDWRLFAPTPPTDTRVLTIACRVQQPDGTVQETDWIDVSTPLWEAHYQNRLSATSGLVYPQYGSIRLLFYSDEQLLALEKVQERQDDTIIESEEYLAYLDRLRESQVQQNDRGHRVLNRIASTYCDQFYGIGNTEKVRVRIAILRYPRFSERHLPDSEGESESYILDWSPYETVASW